MSDLPATIARHEDGQELLRRAEEIVALLRHAIKLGYSITMGPHEMRDLIRIMEDARLTKP